MDETHGSKIRVPHFFDPLWDCAKIVIDRKRLKWNRRNYKDLGKGGYEGVLPGNQT